MTAITQTRRAGPRPTLRLLTADWWKDFGTRWSVLLVFAVIWQLVALRLEHLYFPTITRILARAHDLWFSGPWTRLFLTDQAISDHLGPSLQRLTGGWLAAVVAGIGLGVLIGRARRLADYVDPIVHFVRSIPPPALLPFFVLLLGTGDLMKIVFIAAAVVFPILLNTIDGVRSVDDVQLATGEVYGIETRRRLTHIVLPAAMPKIFAGLRVSLAVALILMVISEMSFSTNGLGFFILRAQFGFRLVDMWAGIVVLGVIGYLLNAIMLKVEGRVLAWHVGARQRGAQ
jgi:ABC-type nitrate/sulfonate/bicarbonate transport system permease component